MIAATAKATTEHNINTWIDSPAQVDLFLATVTINNIHHEKLFLFRKPWLTCCRRQYRQQYEKYTRNCRLPAAKTWSRPPRRWRVKMSWKVNIIGLVMDHLAITMMANNIYRLSKFAWNSWTLLADTLKLVSIKLLYSEWPGEQRS